MSLWTADVDNYNEDEPGGGEDRATAPYDIKLSACHDSTGITVDLTSDQAAFLREIADKVAATSGSACEPTMEIAAHPNVEPCPICGKRGPCSRDAEGRPLIHTDTDLPEDPHQ